jgi:hypothetical protein
VAWIPAARRLGDVLMKLRQALKVRNKKHAGRRYRQRTILAMRRRLMPTMHDTDQGLWFNDMLASFVREAPIEFAALQFKCGMSLAEAGIRYRDNN